MSNPKRPRDPNQRAKMIADIVTGAVEDVDPDEGKDPHAAALGRKGGKKGGKARAKALSSKRKKEIAQKAAKTRWAKKPE